jgi:hypothetical protein
LSPIEWPEAIHLTGTPSPYIGDVLEKVFSQATALVVLMTPDDEAKLKNEFWKDDEPELEKIFYGQSRPNVIFEAGMALGKFPKRTILIEVGNPKPFSDKAGRHVVKLDDTIERRHELAEKLRTAGCAVKTTGQDWIKAGKFTLGEVVKISRDASGSGSVIPNENLIERNSKGYYIEKVTGRLLCGLCYERDGSMRTLIERESPGIAMATVSRGGKSGYASSTEFLKCPECGTEYAHEHKSRRF